MMRMTGKLLIWRAVQIGAIISLSVSVCASAIPAPQVVHGQLDLRGWNFDRDGPVSLTGEWEFYWQQFWSAADFARHVSPEPSGYMRVPLNWNGFVLNGTRLHHTGYAT